MPDEPDQRRCGNCDHLADDHSEGGCWYTLTIGKLDGDLVCPCPMGAP